VLTQYGRVTGGQIERRTDELDITCIAVHADARQNNLPPITSYLRFSIAANRYQLLVSVRLAASRGELPISCEASCIVHTVSDCSRRKRQTHRRTVDQRNKLHTVQQLDSSSEKMMPSSSDARNINSALHVIHSYIITLVMKRRGRYKPASHSCEISPITGGHCVADARKYRKKWPIS